MLKHKGQYKTRELNIPHVARPMECNNRGYVNSLDWSDFTGLLEWSTGVEYWSTGLSKLKTQHEYFTYVLTFTRDQTITFNL